MLWHANSKVHILAKNCEGQKTIRLFKCFLGKLQQKLYKIEEKAEIQFLCFLGGFHLTI